MRPADEFTAALIPFPHKPRVVCKQEGPRRALQREVNWPVPSAEMAVKGVIVLLAFYGLACLIATMFAGWAP